MTKKSGPKPTQKTARPTTAKTAALKAAAKAPTKAAQEKQAKAAAAKPKVAAPKKRAAPAMSAKVSTKAAKAAEPAKAAPAAQPLEAELQLPSGPIRSGLRKTLKGYWDSLVTADPTAVHEARKLTRRAQAELRVADAGKRVGREWRDLRRTAAVLRDHDVAGGHILEALGELGAAPAYLRRFEQGWAERRHELQGKVRWPKRPAGYDLPEGWTVKAEKLLRRDRRRLLAAGEALLAAEDEQGGSEHNEEWHEWRKHLKTYRYTLELLGEVPKPLKNVLDSLGRLQDAEVILDLLKREPKLLPAYRERLRSREEAARTAAKESVRREFPALAAHFKAE